MQEIKRIIDKFGSGKFLWTVGALIIFGVLSLQGKLPTDKVMEVVLIVIYAYFTKATPPKNGGTGNA